MKKYNIINGTSYKIGTPKEVIEILENSRINKTRIRIFYGNESGKDWKEYHDIIGRIGRSGGMNKIPLLLKTKRSIGGCGISDNRIIKITIDKKTVYQHKCYKMSILLTKNKKEIDFLKGITNRI